MGVQARRALAIALVAAVLGVMLFDDGIPDSFRDVLGGLAGLAAVAGVWVAVRDESP